MADNFQTPIATSTGVIFGSDEVVINTATVALPRIKFHLGTDGTSEGDVGAGNPLPITPGSGVVFQVTGQVSLAAGTATIGNVHVSSLPALVAGTATIGSVHVSSLPAGTATIGAVVLGAGTATVGTVALQAAAAVALNAGTATVGTVALQAAAAIALNAGTATVGNVHVSSLPALAAGTATVGTVVLQAAAAVALNAGTATIGNVHVSSLPAGTATIGAVVLGAGTATVGVVNQPTATNFNAAVQGPAAHGAAVAGNPVRAGGKAAIVALPTAAVASGQAVDFIADRWGAQIVTPYHPARTATDSHGPRSVNMTSTANVALVSAPAAGYSTYVTSLAVSNRATFIVGIIFKDGTATGLFQMNLAANGGGFVHKFDPPWQITSGTAFNCALDTTVSDGVRVNTHFYTAGAT